MIGAGVSLGAKAAYHCEDSKPGRPDSATVGTSGIAGERRLPVTAIERRRDALTCAISVGMPVITSWVLPAIVSIAAGDPPLYGTCTIVIPAARANSSVVRWLSDPAPLDA